jgi:pre-rRNA-processing protein TSR3
MRSSGSTRSPRRERPLRLLIVLAGEDHPKACTGRRLIRWNRAERVPAQAAVSPPPVILDPYAPTPLSSADVAAAARGGLLAVDCSWNRLSARGEFPGMGPRDHGHGIRRRLPFLVATNPQHYGRVAQLNTAEALCAALYVVGWVEEAGRLMEGFSGGDEFLSVNRERLDRYRNSVGPSGVMSAERALFGAP